MELLVLVEPTKSGAGFSARLGDPFHISAEAATAEEAFSLVQEEVLRRIQDGLQLRTIPLGPITKSPAPGWLPEDEITQEWRDAVEAHRKAVDIEDRRRILGEPPDEKVAS